MATLNFPTEQFKYYDFYTSFIKSVFELEEEEVVIDPTLRYIVPAAFYIKINGHLAFVDLSDFSDEYNHTLNPKVGWTRTNKFYVPEEMGCPVFKRSVRAGVKYPDNVFPFGPFYVANNKTNIDLRNLLSLGNIYDPFNNEGIIKTNRVWGGALITRAAAYNKITGNRNFLTDRLPPLQHYQRHGNCLSSLNISGAYYDSQDISAVEAMFLGVCGISNDFDIMLPHNSRLIAGEHYIKIDADYSNINECLDYPYQNRSICKDMGDHAYELMMNTCSPKALVKWYEEVVETYYE